MAPFGFSRPVGTIFEPFFDGFEKLGLRKWKLNILIYNHLDIYGYTMIIKV
jgi:hypothetical protein